MNRIAVVDSSPLISLMYLGLASELPAFFDRVLVPRAVHREVNKKGRFRYRLKKLYESGFYRKCTVGDLTNVQLLRDKLDEGEAEALIQAQEMAVAYFIGDEKKAREIGTIFHLKCVGTVRLLGRLNREGRAEEPRTLVRKLRRSLQFRVSDQVVKEAIEMAAEPI